MASKTPSTATSSSNQPSASPADRKKDFGLVPTMLMAGASSMCGASAVFPIDKVKTRVQSARFQKRGVVASLIRTFGGIIRFEGFRGLYRGLAPQLIGITPEKAVKLTSNDFFRRFWRDYVSKDGTLSFVGELMAGIGTGCVQVSVTNPYEVVKIRMQMQQAKGPGIISIIRSLGFRGLYQGFPATVLRDVPFNAIYFSLYAIFKNSIQTPGKELTTSQYLFAGSLAASIAAAVDTPADTIKTRLQNGMYQYKGVRDAIFQIWTTEGPSAFLKGLLPRVLIISPLFGITFTVFEQLKKTFAFLKD